jgi:hypothetical protein
MAAPSRSFRASETWSKLSAHAVVLGENDLRIDATDRARRRHDNDLVQAR